jgi:type II secretory pathway pseudopilin PulG
MTQSRHTLGQSKGRGQRGYILLILMFFVAALGIASLAMVEKISFQMQRDREEELIHRGVQYSRAIRKYFKKFGRYPTRIEDLENTNNIRFLRKRYKDPFSRDPETGKERDFKLLHLRDIQVSINPGAASLLPPTAEANVSADQAVRQLNGAPAGAMTMSNPQSGGVNGDSSADQPVQAAPQNPGGPAAPSGPSTGNTNQPGGFAAAARSAQPQVFGGGAIVGVASTSKAKTIREFNKKNNYNQWQFIYDPSTDRGGLLMTPNQPPLQGAVPMNQQNGNQGIQGQGFGSNNAFGSNNNSGSGQGSPAPPPQPNPQQPNEQ